MSNIEISMPVTDVVARGVKASTTSNNSSKAIQHITSTVKSSAGNATSAVSKAPNQLTEKSIDAAAKEINDVFRSTDTSLGFYVDKSSQRFVVEVKDTDTGETIIKFPGEAVLKVAENIESLKGVLFDKTT
jgi:flagellar protein FlaG|tara:strand:- start:3345 stop:3737 length:393 start_codon:yes stop_codon:yes gene_type:complete